MLYKLQKHSLTRTAWIRPETLGTELNERNASATMTLGPEEPEIAAGDWILDTGTPGGQTVWRAKTIEFTPETGTRTITLEHIIRSLGDYLMFGDVNAETVSGGSSCPARDMARYILGYQTDWVLGRFDYDSSAGWEFNGEKLFDALGTVTGTLDGAWWAYDCSVYPFRLHVVNAGNYFTALSEMRGGRNIQSLRRTIDRSQMYTRFYPIGKDNLHITGDYVSRNENVYGTICKVETDQTKDTEEKLRAWADERLRKHCEPAVTVTISGVDLSGETGEDLDRLMLGRMCRVPLPEYGTAIRERITRLQWRDRMKEPEVVTVTLSNGMENVTSIQEAISEQASSSGRGGRGGAKQAGEDHAWFVDTEDHVAMVAEAIIGRDPEGNPVNWSRVSEIIVDGTGIHQQVVATAGELVTQTTRIDINERGIAAEIIDRTNADNTLQANITATAAELRSEYSAADGNLSSLISQTATEIRQEVKNTEEGLEGKITVQADRITQEVTRAQGAEESLSGKITVEAGKITQIVSAVGADGTVTAASIVTAINSQTGQGEVLIDADKIVIGRGTLKEQELPDWMDTTSGAIMDRATIGQLNTLSARVGTLEADAITAATLASNIADIENLAVHSIRGDGFIVTSGTINGGGDLQYKGTSLGNFIASAEVGDNTLTLKKGDGTVAATFSKATALSADWGSGDNANKLTVTAKQTNGGKETDVASTSLLFSLTASGWSNGKNTVTAKQGSHEIASRELDLGDPSWADPIWNTAKTLVTRTVTIRGREFQTIINTTEAVNAGIAQFEQATVKLQGTAHADITPIGSTSLRLGTVVKGRLCTSTSIKVGSKTSYNMRGDAVSPSTVYTRNTSALCLKKNNIARHYDNDGNLIGNATWYYVNPSGTNYYTSSGSGSYIKTDSALYKDGGSTGDVYPVSSSGTEYFTANAENSYYPLFTSGGTLYYTAGTKVQNLFNAGTEDKTTYYKKKS